MILPGDIKDKIAEKLVKRIALPLILLPLDDEGSIIKILSMKLERLNFKRGYQ